MSILHTEQKQCKFISNKDLNKHNFPKIDLKSTAIIFVLDYKQPTDFGQKCQVN